MIVHFNFIIALLSKTFVYNKDSDFNFQNILVLLFCRESILNLHCDKVWLCSTNNIFGYRCLIASKASTQHAEAE